MRNRPATSTLASLLERWPLAPVEVASLIASLAEVLAHAHRRGVVHGNLHPQAIAIPHVERRFPIVLGGLARSSPPAPVLAAHPYRAPELRRGGEADSRTDIYAVGVIAYQALYGSLPLTGDAPPFTRGAPPMLCALIREMLSNDPDRRPTAEKLQLAIDEVLVLLSDEQIEELADEFVEILEDLAGGPTLRTRAITSEDLTACAGEIAIAG
jgi:serine/threonine protein kinase